MRLAFITHNYPINESERSNAGIFVADLVKNLVRKDHSVIVLVVNSTITKKVVSHKGKLKVYFIGKGSINKSLGYIKPYNPFDIWKVVNLFIQSEKEIIKILKKESIDFSIACWAIPSGILAYRCFKKLHISYSIWALGSDVYVYAKYPLIGSFIKQALRNAKLLLADGIDLNNKVSEVSGKKSYFLPSATEFNNSKEVNKKLNQRKHRFTFLGRIEKVKGPDVLLEAIKNLPNRSDLHVDFVGGGKLLPSLRQKVNEYKLKDCISFLGNVHDKKKIYKYLSGSSYLIIPSRSDSVPLVLSESAKSNTPVIVSDVGDLSYLVRKYKIGYVFPSEDVHKLSKLIFKIIKDEKINDKRFSKNLKIFSKKFDVTTTAESLIKYIKNKK